MAHYKEFFPSRFLQSVTLAEPKTFRILAIHGEELEGDNGKKDGKAIVKYRDETGEGEVVFCKTNCALMEAMTGTPDPQKWINALVTVHHDPSVTFGSEKPGGLRICGAPWLKQTMRVEIKRPRRKKPDVFHLQPTATPGKKTTRESETPSGRFLRLLTDAPDIATVDRIMDDVAATLTDAELSAAQKFADVRRKALAGRSE